MFGFGNKTEIKKIDINEAFRRFEKDPQKIVIICVDEQKDFDNSHIAGAECLPLRLIDKIEDYYPEKELTYFIYAINPSISETACKKAIKHGYNIYNLGSFIDYHEAEEGWDVRKKARKRRK